MATRRIVTFVSDLSGEPVDLGAPVRFSLDGMTYDIDLTSAEREALREAMSQFIAAARTTTNGPSLVRTPDPVAADESTRSRDIRTWATQNGFEVPSRGRIPAVVHEAFAIAH
jgi:hypothetical protein